MGYVRLACIFPSSFGMGLTGPWATYLVSDSRYVFLEDAFFGVEADIRADEDAWGGDDRARLGV